MAKTNIYVLRLEGGRYYVGKSEKITQRVKEHLSGYGSAWTKKYKPMSLVKTVENVSAFEEDKITKEYMSKYGIENVRGGSYVEIELTDFQMKALQIEIWGAKNLCNNCGKSGHFIKNCYAKKDNSGIDLDFVDEWMCNYCDRTFTTAFGCGVHEKSCKKQQPKSTTKKGACYRCGRQGHYSPDCYARTHSDGYSLDSDSDD
jgi:cellular nucleic acid-binding protein